MSQVAIVKEMLKNETHLQNYPARTIAGILGEIMPKAHEMLRGVEYPCILYELLKELG